MRSCIMNQSHALLFPALRKPNMIYRQPYIIVSALHINDKATVSTCQADQLLFFSFFSAQDEKIQRRRKGVISGPDFAVNFNPSKLFFFFRSITFIIRALTCPRCLYPKLGSDFVESLSAHAGLCHSRYIPLPRTPLSPCSKQKVPTTDWQSSFWSLPCYTNKKIPLPQISAP